MNVMITVSPQLDITVSSTEGLLPLCCHYYKHYVHRYILLHLYDEIIPIILPFIFLMLKAAIDKLDQ